MIIQSRDKDQFIDSVLFSTLFYLLSQKGVYDFTKNLFKIVKDRVLIHAVIFALSFLIIQKVTKRM